MRDSSNTSKLLVINTVNQLKTQLIELKTQLIEANCSFDDAQSNTSRMKRSTGTPQVSHR